MSNLTIHEGQLENHLLCVTKGTIDQIRNHVKERIAAGENMPNAMASDMILLYVEYAYTAKWQNSHQCFCTTSYAANALGWTEVRVRRAKKMLRDIGLIKDVQVRDENGKVRGHYVKLRFFIHSEEPSLSNLSKTTPWEIPQGGKDDPKCTGDNKRNALEKYIKENNTLELRSHPQDGRVAPTIEDNTEASKISIEEEKFDLDANKQESGKCGNVLESGEKKQKREPSPEATGIVDRFVSYGLSLNFPSAAERLTAKDKAQMATKVDDCVRLDNVSYERIDAIWRWAVRDSFWSQNFRSLAKLRNKNKDGERWVHYLGDKMDLEHRRSGTVNPAIQAERPKPNLTTNAVGEIIDENGRVRDFPELPANWHEWVDELLNQECFRNHPDTQPELVRGKPFRELHRVLQSQIREIARKHR